MQGPQVFVVRAGTGQAYLRKSTQRQSLVHPPQRHQASHWEYVIDWLLAVINFYSLWNDVLSACVLLLQFSAAPASGLHD